MNLVDSSAWLECLAAGPNALRFRAAIEDHAALLVSPIHVCEVFKRVVHQRAEAAALRAVAIIGQGAPVEVDARVSVEAARLSVLHKLAMTDRLILATTRAVEATLWTQDADFEGLPGVKFWRRAAA